MTNMDTDICIIGSGVAGAIIAKECLDSGKKVIMLEAGGRANGRAFGLRFLENVVRDYRIPRNKIWHRRRTYKKNDYTGKGYPLNGRALIVRGGSTLSWAGDAYRMYPDDFNLFSNTGMGIDWPINYDDLEKYYSIGEKTIRVAGDHLDKDHPQREIPFPVEARPYHSRDDVFLNLMKSRSWSPMHHNISLAPDGSVFTADELITILEKHDNFTLLLGKIAKSIKCESKTRASYIECLDYRTKEIFKIDAQKIAVCAGGIETPNLLLQSTNHWWPDGLGDENNNLGKNMVSHGGVAIGCRPKGIRIFNGPISATAASREFDKKDFQKDGKFLLIWRPAPSGLLFLNSIFEQFSTKQSSVSPGSKDTHFGTKQPVINFIKDERFRKRESYLVNMLEGLISEMGFKIAFRRSYTLAHPMCTVRMSQTPKDGILDSNLKIHAIDNVYVCGSASFSSGGAANPTMTIVALAHRLGKHLGSLK